MKKNHYEAPVSEMTRVTAEDVMTATVIINVQGQEIGRFEDEDIHTIPGLGN